MVDYTTLALGIFLVPIILFQRLGGWPEAWWRISKKPYFVAYIRGPDKRYRKHPDLLANVNTESGLSMWTFGNGAYNLAESEAALSVNGVPMWFFQWNETRAIPQYMDQVVGPDGKPRLEFRPKIPPSVIKAAFKSQVAKDIHREEQPTEGPSGFKWYTVVALGILVLITFATLYFSWNAYCGNHPTAC